MARVVDSSAELESGASLRPLPRLSPSDPAIPPACLLDPVLRKARFLRGLSSTGRNAVLQYAKHRRYHLNFVVIKQGDSANKLFLLLKGSARHFFITPEGRKVNLFWLVPGDIFGGACLLTEPALFIVSTKVTKKSEVLLGARSTVGYSPGDTPVCWKTDYRLHVTTLFGTWQPCGSPKSYPSTKPTGCQCVHKLLSGMTIAHVPPLAGSGLALLLFP